MAETSQKIGGAHVELTAKDVGLEAGLNKAKAATQDYANVAEQSSERSASAFEQASERFKKGAGKQIEAFTSILGKLTAVVGVATTFFHLGQKIGDILESGASKAEKFANSLDLRNAAASLESVDKHLIELEGKLARTQELGIGFDLMSGDTEASIKKQVEEARRLRDSLNKQAHAKEETEERKRAEEAAKKKAEAEAKAQEDVMKGVEERRRDLHSEALDERERIAYEAQRRIEDLERTERQVRGVEAKAAVAALIDEEVAARNRALDEYDKKARKMAEDRHKDELEKIKRQNEARINGILEAQRAFDQYQQQQVNGFGINDLVASLNQIKGLLVTNLPALH